MAEERPEERWTVSCCDEHPWSRVRFRDRALACFACEREGIEGVPHFHNVEVVPEAKLKEQEERCERVEEALRIEEGDRLGAKRAAVESGERCSDLRDALALIHESTNDPRVLKITRTALQHSPGDEGAVK